MLLKLEPSDCQPRKLYVNWEPGTTSEMLIPIVAIPFGRGQRVPRTPLGPGPVHTHTTIYQIRETHILEVQHTQVVAVGQRPQGALATETLSPILKQAEGA